MKKIITMSVLSMALATPAFAAGNAGNIGINASLDNAIGVHGEFMLQKPISLQVFMKNYSRSYNYGGAGSYSYSYTAIGAAGIYDFSKELKFSNPQFHPYAGLGLYTVTATFNGSGAYVSSGVAGGLYLTAGLRYEISPEIDLDGNYNNFGGLTIGANLKF